MVPAASDPLTTTAVVPPNNDEGDGNVSNNQQQERQQEQHHDDYFVLAVAHIFVVPSLAGALFGYDIGATSFAIAQMQDANTAGVVWWRAVLYSPALQGVIVSAASAGALLGSMLIFAVADVIGRRTELRLGSVFYLVGAVLEYLSTARACTTGLGITCLLLGRLLYGMGIGISMHGAPTYLAEMGPTSIRGLLVSLKEVSIVLGMLVGYIVGFLLSQRPAGWAVSYAASLIPAACMLLVSYTIPESARWLLLNGEEEQARQSMQFVFKPEAAELEFQAVKQSTDHNDTTATTTNADEQTAGPSDGEHRTEQGEQEEGLSPGQQRATQPRSLFLDASLRPPLVAGIGLVVLQQITGQPSVLSYATPLFRQTGLSDWASVTVAAIKLVATSVAAAKVESFGRKNLLYTGCSLMLVALVVLSLSFQSHHNGAAPDVGSNGGSSSAADILILVAMFLYIGGYQVGFGPIAWLMISEVFPLQVRGQAVAVAVQVNFLLNAVVQFGVPVLEHWMGLNVTFGLFAVLTAYSIYFIKTSVPETKGLALEQIEQQFKEMKRQPSNSHGGSTEMEPLVVVPS